MIFSLPKNDSLIEYSTQISYGLLIQAKLDKHFSLELAKRFSNVHQLSKKQLKEEPNDFSGKTQFTGRTINFISKYFIRNLKKLNQINQKELIDLIIKSIKTFYWNSFQNKKKLPTFQSELLKTFTKTINVNIIEEENVIENLNEKLSEILNNINHFLDNNNSEIYFSFKSFVNAVQNIKLKDITKIKKILQYII